MLGRIVREPLFHFFLLGAALFLGYHFWGTRIDHDEPGKIVVTQGKIDNLITTFTRAWNRPPTQAELKGLVDEYVREEVCVREAISLGLDRDDSIIRRRLRQKMEFLFEDVAAQANPTDDELQVYLKKHSDKFQTEARFTFQQVYFNPERHTELSSYLTKLRNEWNQNPRTVDLTAQGDSLLLEHFYDSVSAKDVNSQFGEKFEAQLSALPVGQWEGPVESGYGFHLVLIKNRMEGKLPEFSQIREEVRREWENDKRIEMNKVAFDELLKRYTVIIESPKEQQKSKDVAQE